ncbi:MAG: biliverdin-producing heme oxygenase [Comamonadaceae bacterium]|nr:MAG: biliverdin-producing heme oxygenase [Comamonadaceae bacterium]
MADPQHYGRLLQVFDAFLGPWEDRVAAVLPADAHGWLRQRSRRPFVRDDLRALGLPRLAAPAQEATLSSAAEAWGSLYVLEGSALGGQLITRAVAAHGFSPESGAAYFHGWGAATGAMWREFRALLEEHLPEPDDIRSACAGAVATFDALSASFEAHVHERAATA